MFDVIFFLVFELVLNRLLFRFLKCFYFYYGYSKFVVCLIDNSNYWGNRFEFYFALWSLLFLFIGDFCCFVVLGSVFVFVKCNAKVDVVVLVGYVDLVKKKSFIYIVCFLCFCEIFFLKFLYIWSIVRI